MLRATNSVLRSGARNCFYVISTREGLTDADRRRLAEREGNEHVETPRPYERLMELAGFVDIEVSDVTPEYIETIASWKREWEAEAEALTELLGQEEFARRIHNRVLDIANAEDGLMHRVRVLGAKA